MTDEGGVLGNLPNERPGRRSAKRDRPATAAEKAAVRAEEAGKPASDPARTSTPKRTSSPGRTTAAQDEGSGDLVGAAVRGAAGLAATGVKVAGAVTQELFRRLPRP